MTTNPATSLPGWNIPRPQDGGVQPQALPLESWRADSDPEVRELRGGRAGPGPALQMCQHLQWLDGQHQEQVRSGQGEAGQVQGGGESGGEDQGTGSRQSGQGGGRQERSSHANQKEN